jgi:predicted metal-dependent HD superfamily phosphohydrolase
VRQSDSDATIHIIIQVSVSFKALAVGRWTHDVIVRNLANKHDQVSNRDTCNQLRIQAAVVYATDRVRELLLAVAAVESSFVSLCFLHVLVSSK